MTVTHALVDEHSNITCEPAIDPAGCIAVEVAYALPERQTVIALQVPVGSTLTQAVECSGIVEQCGLAAVDALSLGVFGKLEKSPETRVLQEGDRVEIYRPLLGDPKKIRKARAAKR